MTNDTNLAPQEPEPPGGTLAGGGILTGLAALIGASCCVLPIILVQLGVSTALVAHLAIFARANPYFLTATVMLIVAGFIVAYWGGRKPRRRVLVLLVAAAMLVVGAYGLPFYEQDILTWVRGQ